MINIFNEHQVDSRMVVNFTHPDPTFFWMLYRLDGSSDDTIFSAKRTKSMMPATSTMSLPCNVDKYVTSTATFPAKT